MTRTFTALRTRARLTLLSLLALLAGLVTALAPAAGAAPCTKCTVPAVGATFQYQLARTFAATIQADVYGLDGFDTPRTTVRELRADGRHVLCYISAGSFEDWRPDRARFPKRVLGEPLDDWPGERWLDIRDLDGLQPVMTARMKMCRHKGFTAVDFDNVNAWEHENTGFAISARHQLRYNRWLAAEAHRLGLAAALKNDGPQVPKLVEHFDMAVVEQCVQLDECDQYRPFVARGKPVFDIEYNVSRTTFCPLAAQLQFTIIRKRLRLDSWRRSCS